jgi:dTDP-3-amino-2,3,6-trideoxy-4-keto-D-glucose/dTDP-3-amino-3,4,6-trideoxy-alpha-D-glucose/dTDP-2,6-dideoxy-D-kanosamine transaminase
MIKVWDYLKEYENEKDEIHQAIEEVLKSGWLILGEKVRKFEEEFAAWCSMNYGVGVNSGTDAIFLGLKALDIGTGDEVITVSNTAVPTVSAITATGATPVFVDVEEGSYLMDVTKVEDAITAKTKCIIPVHLFGQCVDMDNLNTIADKHGIYVLEDCAQCHGALYNGRIAGSMSIISAFSFYPTKVLGTFGDGGMILTNNEEIKNRLKRLRFYGMDKTYYSLEQGYNSRLDEMQASILLRKFGHINEYIDNRRRLASKYNTFLNNSTLKLPEELPGRKHTYYLYVVRHIQRDRIIEELKRQDIHVNISYPWPIHTMTGFKHLGYQEGDLPVTERLAREIFSLPLYPYLQDHEQEYVIESLLKILEVL